MFPLADMAQCQNIAVPLEVMQHVVQVESSFNPYAIGVVGGQLVRQPKSLAEAISTAEMLEQRGYNFSVGLAQVNRYNLSSYGLDSYAKAFDGCTNLRAGARILSECQVRAKGDWGKAFSCYYSGNFTTGYQHGYVQKILTSIEVGAGTPVQGAAIPLVMSRPRRTPLVDSDKSALERRVISATSQSEGLTGSASGPAAQRLASSPAMSAEARADPASDAVAGPASPFQVSLADGDSAVATGAPPVASSTSHDLAKPASGTESQQLAEIGTALENQPTDKAFVF